MPRLAAHPDFHSMQQFRKELQQFHVISSLPSDDSDSLSCPIPYYSSQKPLPLNNDVNEAEKIFNGSSGCVTCKWKVHGVRLCHVLWPPKRHLAKNGSSSSSCDTVDGWNPANQLRLVVYPMIYKVLYIPGGAAFQPSTVAVVVHREMHS